MEETICIKQEVFDDGYTDFSCNICEDNEQRKQNVEQREITLGQIVCKEEDDDGTQYAVYLQKAIKSEETSHVMNTCLREGIQDHPNSEHEIMNIKSDEDKVSTETMYIAPIVTDENHIFHETVPPLAEKSEHHEKILNNHTYRNFHGIKTDSENQEYFSNNSEPTSLSQTPVKQFKCEFCGKIYMKESYLEKHLFTHNTPSTNEPKQLKKNKISTEKKACTLFCDFCNREFFYQSDLKRHLVSHDDTKPFICHTCGASYKQQKSLNAHMANKHSDANFARSNNFKLLQCKKCPLTFSCLSKLEAHQKVHTDEKPYVCNKCGRQYKYMHSLNEHLQTHANELCKQCRFCGLMFSSRSELKSHWRESAGDEMHTTRKKKQTCEICGKVFHSGFGLKRHMLSHTDERKFQCSVCGLKFKQSAHLKSHIATHDKEKKQKIKPLRTPVIPCKKCHLVFGTRSELKSHLEESSTDGIHGDVAGTMLPCETCGKEFSSRTRLERHRKSHLDRRPYECHICKLCLKTASHLKAHICTHIKFVDSNCTKTCLIDGKEKIVFLCSECKKEFRTKKLLKIHLLDCGGDGLHAVPQFVTNFQCDICSEVFSGNSGLHNHLKVHEEKHYSCDVCGQEFPKRAELINHVNSHKKSDSSLLKKAKCVVCNKEFDKKCDLKVHLVESIGDGLHKTANCFMSTEQACQCPYCDKFVPNKGGLKLHIFRMHRRKEQNNHIPDTDVDIQTSTNLQILINENDIKVEIDEKEEDFSASVIKKDRTNNSTEIVQENDLNTAHGTKSTELSSTVNSKISPEIHPNVNPHLKKSFIASDCIVYTEAGKRYECCVCQKLFQKIACFKLHIKTHEKNIKCEKCGKLFYRDSNLKDHIDNQYQCSLCQERFCQALLFKKHNRMHRREKMEKLKCKFCQKSFLSEVKLAFHTSSHTGEKAFECEICKLDFKHYSGLKMHMHNHGNLNDKGFLCDVCGKTFTNSTTLRSHRKIHIKSKETFKCIHCDKTYTHRESLTYHIRIQHKDSKFKCRICQRSFVHPGSMRIHEQKHSGIKPFTCEVCGKTFFTKNFLKMHSIVHTKIKNYSCDICGKKFGQPATVVRHKRSMHVSRPITYHKTDSSSKIESLASDIDGKS